MRSIDGKVIPTINEFKEYENKGKGNPYHDKLGRFTTGPSGSKGASAKAKKKAGDSEIISAKTKKDPDGLGLTKKDFSYEKIGKTGPKQGPVYYLREFYPEEDDYEDVLAFEKIKGKKKLLVLEVPTFSRLTGKEFDSLDSLAEAYVKDTAELYGG